MRDGNERPSKPSRQQHTAAPNYTMHPYYQQQYYPMGGQPAAAMYPVADPTQPGGYRWMYAAYAHPSMMQYYYPYMASGGGVGYYAPGAPQAPMMAAAYGQGSPTVSESSYASQAAAALAVSGSNVSSSGVPTETTPAETEDTPSASMCSIPHQTHQPSTSSSIEDSTAPMPPPLLRKTSKGFLKDNSKWRLSRSGSKPTLAIDGMNEDGEYMELPPSPRLGVHKQSFCVSPRHCGSPFLPDDQMGSSLPKLEEHVPKKVFKNELGQMHLIDAVRVCAGELALDPVDERYHQLESVLDVDMDLFEISSTPTIFFPTVCGLQNPPNTKICYLNSIVQILLPLSPFVQSMSLSLSEFGHLTIPWTLAIGRSMRLFYEKDGESLLGNVGRKKSLQGPSLMSVPGMDYVVKELGGLGKQQDVAEALSIVIEKLHEEWKHVLVHKPWKDIGNGSGNPLCEDSLMYKLFRGVKQLQNQQLEMFTAIHLAPSKEALSLTELLTQNFSENNALIHYCPPVLCIELSRHLSENQLTTSQCSVPFSGKLRLPESCVTADCNQREYELIGLVVRSGVYANSGHFWVAQRRENSWNWINDNDVTAANVTVDEQNDSSLNSISKKLDASQNWCLLIYADTHAKVKLRP